MSAIYALCPDPESAQKAVDALEAAGIPERDITICSSQPYEEYRFGQKDSETSIQWVAVGGAAFGFVATVSIVSLVQLAWPLRTGGMPIVPILPNLIPIFEMTMLGAVVAAVIALCVTARIPRRLPELYDAAVSDDKILVGISEPPSAKLPEIEEALRANGDLQRIG